MSDLNFIHEGETDPFEVVQTVDWVPNIHEIVYINGTEYKAESIEYHLTVNEGSPNALNPRWVSSEYVKIFLSLVP